MLRWSEVEAMRRTGTFEFHSHTHTHTRWDKSPADISRRIAALTEDIDESRRTLQARLGGVSRHLCWPQGYYEPAYVEAACAVGFDHLYTTAKRPNLRGGDSRFIGRVVTKERPGSWLGRRLAIYRSPILSRLYSTLRGENE